MLGRDTPSPARPTCSLRHPTRQAAAPQTSRQMLCAASTATVTSARQSLADDSDEVQSLINRAATASADDLASDVLNGLFGNGDTRRAILGSRYDEVQTIVNGKANGVDIDALARAVIRGEYGDGETRKAKLGANYDAVQKRVNELL